MKKLNQKEPNRLKIVREQLGFTQKELCEQLDISENKIKTTETGIVKISVDLALSLEKKFNFSFKWLLTGEGQMMVRGSNYVENSEIDSSPSNIRLHPVVRDHVELVQQFENHEAAMEINQDLLYIERESKEAFEKARNIIKGLKEGISIKTEGDRRKKSMPFNPDRRQKVS